MKGLQVKKQWPVEAYEIRSTYEVQCTLLLPRRRELQFPRHDSITNVCTISRSLYVLFRNDYAVSQFNFWHFAIRDLTRKIRRSRDACDAALRRLHAIHQHIHSMHAITSRAMDAPKYYAPSCVAQWNMSSGLHEALKPDLKNSSSYTRARRRHRRWTQRWPLEHT